MAKWWEEEGGSTDAAPASSGPNNSGTGKWWEEPDVEEVQPASKKPKFTPRIGGFVPKEEEKWSNPKFIANQVLGGAATRNIPFVRDIIPMTESEREKTEYLEKNAPELKTVGDAAATVVGGLPFAGIGGSLGLPGYMAAQAATNVGVNAADRAVHDPNISAQDQFNAAKLDALFGAAGPAVGKVISPRMVPNKPVQEGASVYLPKIGNFQPHATGIPNNQGVASPIYGKRYQNYIANKEAERYIGMPSGLKAISPLPNNAMDDIAKYAYKNIIPNQLMTDSNKVLLNSIMGAPVRSPNMLSDEQRRKLEVLGGQ